MYATRNKKYKNILKNCNFVFVSILNQYTGGYVKNEIISWIKTKPLIYLQYRDVSVNLFA